MKPCLVISHPYTQFMWPDVCLNFCLLSFCKKTTPPIWLESDMCMALPRLLGSLVLHLEPCIDFNVLNNPNLINFHDISRRLRCSLLTWHQDLLLLCCVTHSAVSPLCDPVGCSPPGSSVRGILQERILEWVAMPSSRESSNLGMEPRSSALQADT